MIVELEHEHEHERDFAHLSAGRSATSADIWSRPSTAEAGSTEFNVVHAKAIYLRLWQTASQQVGAEGSRNMMGVRVRSRLAEGYRGVVQGKAPGSPGSGGRSDETMPRHAGHTWSCI